MSQAARAPPASAQPFSSCSPQKFPSGCDGCRLGGDSRDGLSLPGARCAAFGEPLPCCWLWVLRAQGAPADAGGGSQGLPVPPSAEGAVPLASSCPGRFSLPPVSLDGNSPRCPGSSRVCCGAGERGCGGQQVRRPHSSPSLPLVLFSPRLHAHGCRERARSRRAVKARSPRSRSGSGPRWSPRWSVVMICCYLCN